MEENRIVVYKEEDGVQVDINWRDERDKFDLLTSLFASLIDLIGKDEVLEMVKWGKELRKLEGKEE